MIILCIDVFRISVLKLKAIQWDKPPLKCWDTKQSYLNVASKIWSTLHRSNNFDEYSALVLNYVVQLYADFPFLLVRSLLVNPKWDNSKLDEDILSLLSETDYGNSIIDALELSNDDTPKSKAKKDKNVEDKLKRYTGNQILSKLRVKLGDKLMLWRLLFDAQICKEFQLDLIKKKTNEIVKKDEVKVTPLTLPVDIWKLIAIFGDVSTLMRLSCLSTIFLRFIYTSFYASQHTALRQLVLTDERASKFVLRLSNTYLFKGMQDLHVKISGSILKRSSLPHFTAIYLKRYQTNGIFNLVVIPPLLEKVIINFDDEIWNKYSSIFNQFWNKFVQISAHRDLKLFMLCNDVAFQFHNIPVATVLVWHQSHIFGSLMKHVMFHNKIDYLVFIDTEITEDMMLLDHPQRLQIRQRTCKNFYYICKKFTIKWQALINTLIVYNYFTSFCPKLVIKCSVNAAEQSEFRLLLSLIAKKTDLPMEIVLIIDCQSDSYSDHVQTRVNKKGELIDKIFIDWLNNNYSTLMENESIKSFKLAINVQSNPKQSEEQKFAKFMFDIKQMVSLKQLNENLLNIKKTMDYDSTRDKLGETMLIEEWNDILEEIYAKTQ